MNTEKIRAECGLECPEECEKTHFVSDRTYASLPPSVVAERSRVIGLQVFYGSHNGKITTQIVKMTGAELFSNIGGILGKF